jgi:hypothetical protein
MEHPKSPVPWHPIVTLHGLADHLFAHALAAQEGAQQAALNEAAHEVRAAAEHWRSDMVERLSFRLRPHASMLAKQRQQYQREIVHTELAEEALKQARYRLLQVDAQPSLLDPVNAALDDLRRYAAQPEPVIVALSANPNAEMALMAWEVADV